MTEAVLVYPRRGNRVLLGLHRRGIGVGKWNGPGGKVEPPETYQAAAVREVKREVHLEVDPGDPYGLLVYHHERSGDWRVVVFRTFDFSGQPQPSDEMIPAWFNIDALPQKTMFDNDHLWLPLVFDRHHRHFQGEFWLDRNSRLKKDPPHKLVEVPKLDMNWYGDGHKIE